MLNIRTIYFLLENLSKSKIVFLFYEYMYIYVNILLLISEINCCLSSMNHKYDREFSKSLKT